MHIHSWSGSIFSILRNRKFLIFLRGTHKKQSKDNISIVGNVKLANIKTNKFSRYSASTIIMSTQYKEFYFNKYDIVGFDLDCTLLRYNLNEMVPLCYHLLRNYLVEKKEYPRELLDKAFDVDFLQKGLIIDADRGNILKLSNDEQILRATHGTKLLSGEEIKEIYGDDRKWELTTKFIEDPLSTWNGPNALKLRTLLDYFDITASLVVAQAVDELDRQAILKKEAPPIKYNVWPDVLDGLIEIYDRDNYQNNKSDYFKALRAQPSRYILKTSDEVLNWLKELRSQGKALFLLTGSNIDFANFTATYALGKDWQELFDCVVCYAKKPGFFTIQREFLRIENEKEVPNSNIKVNEILPLNEIYSQGNWLQLQTSLAQKLNKSPSNILSLYFGDNLIQDVYAPYNYADIKSIVLCEELLAEGGYDKNYPYQNIVGSTFWGSYFMVDEQTTIWAEIIAQNGELCIPKMDVLAEMHINNCLCCENAEGYFPKAPNALLD